MGRLKLAVIVLIAAAAAACASSGAVPKPFPGARSVPDREPAPSALPAPLAPLAPLAPPALPASPAPLALMETALKFRGVPYRNGGSDPAGFDCSGFVQYVFAQHGLPLPREVREQFRFGDSVDVRDVRPGDLIFFSTVAAGPSHVGVALVGDEFVHAPSSRGRVRVERFSSSYWSPRIVGIRRLKGVGGHFSRTLGAEIPTQSSVLEK